MGYNTTRKIKPTLPHYLACYASWLGLSAIGMWLVFAMRSALFDIGIWLRLNPWQVRALDQFGTVTLGLIWLVGMFWLEYWLRQGMLKGRLRQRVTRALLFAAVALGLCYAVQAVLG